MEFRNVSDPYDNKDVESRHSRRSTKKDSRALSCQKHKKNLWNKMPDEDEKDSCFENRSKTRIFPSHPELDQISDGEGRRSSGLFYSDDYESNSSDSTISQYSQSRKLSPMHPSMNPLHKTGSVWRRSLSRPQRPGGLPLIQQHCRGMRSKNKESAPPKDLNSVTKRMLSAHLLKINELRNALTELQKHTDELQKENRVLRQLQVRQEKALQRNDDIESEISHLLSCHNNETHVLREQLRRTQEREQAAERRLKDSEEQLQRSKATVARLKKLVDQKQLGARDKLSRSLEEEKTRAREVECKLKELEHSMELSNSSYQRQLAAERKKTISAQEEIKILQEELKLLTNKLKEKERELDAKNIYANHMMKPAQRKYVDSSTKRKVLSRSSTKAVQTKDRPSSLDFPTPPPAITDANGYSEQTPDEYLSLKELDRVEGQAETEDEEQKLEQQKMRDREKERHKEKELVKEKEERQLSQQLKVLEEKEKRLKDGSEKKEEEEERKRTSSLSNQEEENNRKHGHVQEEVKRWNQGALGNQQAAEEARRKKEQLLAKMREIDHQGRTDQDAMFAESSPSESNKATSNHSSPCLPEQRNNSVIFNHTEPEESASLRTGAVSGDGGKRRSDIEGGDCTTGKGRRATRPQMSRDDLAFGSYATSFGSSASRGSSGFSPPLPKEGRDSLEAIGVFRVRGVEIKKETEMERGAAKDRKSSLMQQLFGALATPVDVSTMNKMEVLSSPATTNGVRSRRELLSFNSGSSTPPASSLNTLHVTATKPTSRAIPSFDEDIEELTL